MDLHSICTWACASMNVKNMATSIEVCLAKHYAPTRLILLPHRA